LKKALIIAVLILIVAAGFTLASRKAEDPPLEESISPRHVSAEGKVEALPGFDIRASSEITGKIDKFFVKEGEWVKKGALIARLDNKDVQARLKEAEGEVAVAKARLAEVASGARVEEIKKAEANYQAAKAELDLAKKHLDRNRQLYEQGIIPKAALDEKERNFFVADARVNEALEEKTLLENGPKKETLKLYEDMLTKAEATVGYYNELLEKSIIKAHIAGKVIRKFLEDGEMADPESPLVAIADIERTRINAEVDETDIGRIKVGDTAEVTCDAYPGKVFKGTVREISDYAGHRKIKPNNAEKNMDMKIIQVKIELSEKNPLRLGMSVDVIILPD